jgi:hypothetical protein
VTTEELILALEDSASSDKAISESGALTSIAISLKRIADAMWGDRDTAGLLQLLNPLDTRNHY